MAYKISVMSPKGGVGKTFVSSHLGYALSRLGFKVLVVDTNLGAPNLGLYLGVRPGKDFYFNDVVFKINPHRAVHEIDDLLHIIPANVKDIDVISINLERLKHIVTNLNNYYHFVFFDTEPGLTNNNKHLMNVSDKILFVTTPELPTLVTTNRMISYNHQFIKKDYSLIINMYNKIKFLNEQDIQKLLESEIIGRIPYDKKVVKYTNEGKILNSGGVFKSITKIAEALRNDYMTKIKVYGHY